MMNNFPCMDDDENDSIVVDMEGWWDSDFDGPEKISTFGAEMSNEDLYSSNYVINVTLSKLDENSTICSKNILPRPSTNVFLSINVCQDNQKTKHYTDYYGHLMKNGFTFNPILKEVVFPNIYSNIIAYPIATHLTIPRTKNEKLREQILREANPPPTVIVHSTASKSRSGGSGSGHNKSTTSTSHVHKDPHRSTKEHNNSQVMDENEHQQQQQVGHSKPRHSSGPQQESHEEPAEEEDHPDNLPTRKSSKADPPLPTTFRGKCWLHCKDTMCIKHIRSGCRHFHNRVDGSEKFNAGIFILVVILVIVFIVCVIVFPVVMYKKHHKKVGGGPTPKIDDADY